MVRVENQDRVTATDASSLDELACTIAETAEVRRRVVTAIALSIFLGVVALYDSYLR